MAGEDSSEDSGKLEHLWSDKSATLSKEDEALLTKSLQGRHVTELVDFCAFLVPVMVTEEYKENRKDGTAAYQRKDFPKAVEKWNWCLEAVKKEKMEEDKMGPIVAWTELSRLFANLCMVHLKAGDVDKAVETGFQAVHHCGSWPKAHARYGEALAALGRHDLACQSFAMAMRKAQEYTFADQKANQKNLALYKAREDEERQIVEDATKLEADKVEEERRRCAEEDFDRGFFEEALKLRALTQTEYLDVYDQLRRGKSKADLVLQWRDTHHHRTAQLNTGALARLDVSTLQSEILEQLPPEDLASIEATCRFFTLDDKDRIRRISRCHRLLKGYPSLRGDVIQYCDDADSLEAIERLAEAYAAAVLEAGHARKFSEKGYWSAAADVVDGMSYEGALIFWRSYLVARDRWIRTKLLRRTVPPDYGIFRELFISNHRSAGAIACLSLALPTAEKPPPLFRSIILRDFFHDMERNMESRDQIEATVDDWLRRYDECRKYAGVEIEILNFIHRYQPSHSLREEVENSTYEMACSVIHTTYRSQRKAFIGILRVPLATQLQKFYTIYSAGPGHKRWPDATERTPGALALTLDYDPNLLAVWVSTLRPVKAWLKENDTIGFALHVYAHSLLHIEGHLTGVGWDWLVFQALLVTQSFMFGWRTVAKRLETSSGLGMFFADLYAMVDIYSNALPKLTPIPRT